MMLYFNSLSPMLYFKTQNSPKHLNLKHPNLFLATILLVIIIQIHFFEAN